MYRWLMVNRERNGPAWVTVVGSGFWFIGGALMALVGLDWAPVADYGGLGAMAGALVGIAAGGLGFSSGMVEAWSSSQIVPQNMGAVLLMLITPLVLIPAGQAMEMTDAGCLAWALSSIGGGLIGYGKGIRDVCELLGSQWPSTATRTAQQFRENSEK